MIRLMTPMCPIPDRACVCICKTQVSKGSSRSEEAFYKNKLMFFHRMLHCTCVVWWDLGDASEKCPSIMIEHNLSKFRSQTDLFIWLIWQLQKKNLRRHSDKFYVTKVKNMLEQYVWIFFQDLCLLIYCIHQKLLLKMNPTVVSLDIMLKYMDPVIIDF